MPVKLIQFMTYPGVSLLDLAGPLDVFMAANHFAPPDHPPYSLSILALSSATEIFSNFSLNAEILVADTPAAHTLIVPGGPGIPCASEARLLPAHLGSDECRQARRPMPAEL